MQSDSHLDSYNPDLLRALGLVTLEFSRMEATALDLLARLTSPDQFTGEIVAAGAPLSSALDRLQAMASQRIRPGVLQSAVLSWIRDARSAAEARNGTVHARWALTAVTIKTGVKKGKLEHKFTHRSVGEIRDLARRMWELCQEGTHLSVDLAMAGFAAVTEVSDTGVKRTPPTTNFPVDGSTILPRPDPAPHWPGEATIGARE
jgi:hypothetical protein